MGGWGLADGGLLQRMHDGCQVAVVALSQLQPTRAPSSWTMGAWTLQQLMVGEGAAFGAPAPLNTHLIHAHTHTHVLEPPHPLPVGENFTLACPPSAQM